METDSNLQQSNRNGFKPKPGLDDLQIQSNIQKQYCRLSSKQLGQLAQKIKEQQFAMVDDEVSLFCKFFGIIINSQDSCITSQQINDAAFDILSMSERTRANYVSNVYRFNIFCLEVIKSQDAIINLEKFLKFAKFVESNKQFAEYILDGKERCHLGWILMTSNDGKITDAAKEALSQFDKDLYQKFFASPKIFGGIACKHLTDGMQWLASIQSVILNESVLEIRKTKQWERWDKACYQKDKEARRLGTIDPTRNAPRIILEDEKLAVGRDSWSQTCWGSNTVICEAFRRGFLVLGGHATAGRSQDLRNTKVNSLKPCQYPVPHGSVLSTAFKPVQPMQVFTSIKVVGKTADQDTQCCQITRNRNVVKCPLALHDGFLVFKHQIMQIPLAQIDKDPSEWAHEPLIYGHDRFQVVTSTQINSWLEGLYNRTGIRLTLVENTRHKSANELLMRGSERRNVEVLGGWKQDSGKKRTMDNKYGICTSGDILATIAGFPSPDDYFLVRAVVEPWNQSFMHPLLYGLFPQLKELEDFVVGLEKNDPKNPFISCRRGFIDHYRQAASRFFQDMIELQELFPNCKIYHDLPLFQNEEIQKILRKWKLLAKGVSKVVQGILSNNHNFRVDSQRSFQMVNHFLKKNSDSEGLEESLRNLQNEVFDDNLDEKFKNDPIEDVVRKHIPQLLLSLDERRQKQNNFIRLQDISDVVQVSKKQIKQDSGEHKKREIQFCEERERLQEVTKNAKKLKQLASIIPNPIIQPQHSQHFQVWPQNYPEQWVQYYDLLSPNSIQHEVKQPGLDEFDGSVIPPWNQWWGIPTFRPTNVGGQQSQITLKPDQAWLAWCVGIEFTCGNQVFFTPPLGFMEYQKQNFKKLGLKRNDPQTQWRSTSKKDIYKFNKTIQQLKTVVYQIDQQIQLCQQIQNLQEKLNVALKFLKDNYQSDNGGFSVSSIARNMEGKVITPRQYEKTILQWECS